MAEYNNSHSLRERLVLMRTHDMCNNHTFISGEVSPI